MRARRNRSAPGPGRCSGSGRNPERDHFWSSSRWGTAALLTGTLGGVFGLEHAYWPISTWVLILQGLAPPRTTWRGLEQLTGTRVGLGRCNTGTHAHALWLVGAITVLTFLVKPQWCATVAR